MGLFSGVTSLFGGGASAPDLSQTNYSAAAQQGATYNQSQIPQYEQYAPGLNSFMKSQYNSLVNPQATQAQNTEFNLGNQLATQGYTNAQSNFLNYSRTLGLENAASTGAPISGSFAQGLGTNLGMQQILGNQLQGQNLLNNYSTNQQGLAQSFEQPAQGILNSTLVSPGLFMQGAAANNAIANQNSYINFANSQNNGFLGNLLTGAVSSAISTPFSSFENINSASSNPVGDISQICGKGGGGGGTSDQAGAGGGGGVEGDSSSLDFIS